MPSVTRAVASADSAPPAHEFLNPKLKQAVSESLELFNKYVGKLDWINEDVKQLETLYQKNGVNGEYVVHVHGPYGDDAWDEELDGMAVDEEVISWGRDAKGRHRIMVEQRKYKWFDYNGENVRSGYRVLESKPLLESSAFTRLHYYDQLPRLHARIVRDLRSEVEGVFIPRLKEKE